MNTAYKVIVVLELLSIFAVLCGIEEDINKASKAAIVDNSVLVKFDPSNRNDGLDLAYNPSTGELKVVRVGK